MAGWFQFQARSGGRRRRRRWPAVQLRWVPQLLLVVLLIVLAASGCEASRGMQPFEGRPLGRGGSNHFFGFLPRGPVPPSGPSRQHNSVGAEDEGNP